MIRDTEKQFVTSTEVKRWINQAYLDLAARLKILRADQTGTVGADGDVDCPVDFIEPVWLRLDEDDVEFVDDNVFHSNKDAGAIPPTTIGRALGNTIELYPVPDAAQEFTLRYVQAPTDLVSPPDVPSLPTHLHQKLVQYGRYEAYAKVGQPGEAQTQLALYEDGLPPKNTGRPRTFPGPIQLQPSPSPFDVDSWGVAHR